MPESGQQEIELSSRNNNGDNFDAPSSNSVGMKPRGLFFPWPIIAVVLVGTALVFTGSILATYYGKTCPDCPKANLAVECEDYYCQNQNVLQCKSLKKCNFYFQK